MDIRIYDPAEAEGIIAMLSEWLELDSTDDWVRHDAEIVSFLPLFLQSSMSHTFHSRLSIKNSPMQLTSIFLPSSFPLRGTEIMLRPTHAPLMRVLRGRHILVYRSDCRFTIHLFSSLGSLLHQHLRQLLHLRWLFPLMCRTTFVLDRDPPSMPHGRCGTSFGPCVIIILG